MVTRLLPLLIATGCHEYFLPLEPQVCNDLCIADPAIHCIKETDCQSDTDCPSGLSCGGSPFLPATSCSIPGIDDRRHCLWQRPVLNQELLITELDFDIDLMEIQVIGGLDARIEWTNPPRARFVKCAVFTCQPEVGVRGPYGDPTRTSPIGESLRYISNAAACLYDRWRATSPPRASLSFAVNDRFGDIHLRPSNCIGEFGDSSYDRVITLLAAGCWAYDDHHIIAASRLLRIDLEIARTFLDLEIAATCSFDGQTCHNDVLGFFGACVGTECRPRCSTPADCVVAPEPPGSSCHWRCDPVPNSRVGVCVPLDEALEAVPVRGDIFSDFIDQ